MPIQTPVPPILTPALRAVQSLPEPMVQSQKRSQPQHHLPAPLPLFKPTLTCITQPIGNRIEHGTVPPYPHPLLRPPPRPPDVTDVKVSRKDLLVWTWTEMLTLKRIHHIRRV